MSAQKLSVNRACAVLGAALLCATGGMTAVLYILTQNGTAVLYLLIFCAFVMGSVACFIGLLRRKLTLFSDLLCQTLDDMMAGESDPVQPYEEESLFYKIQYRMARLYEVMSENRRRIARERAELQELVSDISHQVKTPIANLKMINSTLQEQEVPEQKQREFLSAQAGQLDKLNFLMQAMIKTSRLETGVISLEKKIQPVYDTLAIALGGILLNAEQKHIDVQVSCPEHLAVSHDRKWTGEALFNILDNAVKYTPDGGRIRVGTECMEVYLKISISDTGKGIAEVHHGTVFKRFYREDDVHEVEGIGIGLYLAREIITLQGGYIRLESAPGEGSCFSVFLPRE